MPRTSTKMPAIVAVFARGLPFWQG